MRAGQQEIIHVWNLVWKKGGVLSAARQIGVQASDPQAVI